ncbi:MAG: HEAT repeat domain-containing protein [bacterium]
MVDEARFVGGAGGASSIDYTHSHSMNAGNNGAQGAGGQPDEAASSSFMMGHLPSAPALIWGCAAPQNIGAYPSAYSPEVTKATGTEGLAQRLFLGNDRDISYEARIALDKMGLAALPVFFEYLRSRQTPADEQTDHLENFDQSQPKYRIGWYIGGHIGPAAIPDLIVALKDPNWEVRQTAALALGQMKPAAAAAVVPVLTSLSKTDQDWHVRTSAITGLRQLGPAAAAAVPALIDVFNTDKDWPVRHNVLTAFGEDIGFVATPAAVSMLRAALIDDREIARFVRSIEKQEKWVGSGDLRPSVMSMLFKFAKAASAASGPDLVAAIPELVCVLSDPNPDMRSGAVDVLVAIAKNPSASRTDRDFAVIGLSARLACEQDQSARHRLFNAIGEIRALDQAPPKS